LTKGEEKRRKYSIREKKERNKELGKEKEIEKEGKKKEEINLILHLLYHTMGVTQIYVMQTRRQRSRCGPQANFGLTAEAWDNSNIINIISTLAVS
jgi:hypothetical protein